MAKPPTRNNNEQRISDLAREKYKGLVNTLGSPIYGRIVFLSLTAILLFLTLYRYPFYPVFYDGDHLIQMYDAVRMLQGDVLYRDFFQFTFPGTEVWYLILFKIFGQRLWLLNGTILFLGLSLAWALLELSFRVTRGWFAYLAPAIFMFLGFRWLATDGSHRLFSLLFAVLAVYALCRRITRGRLFLAGILTGFASFFTQTRGLALIAGLTLFFIWYYWPRDSSSPIAALKNVSKAVSILAGAFLITLGALLAYFILPAPGQFLESTLFFGKNYLADPANQWSETLKTVLSAATGELDRVVIITTFYLVIIIAAFSAFAFYYIKDRKKFGFDFWYSPMLLLCSSIFMVLSSPGTIRLGHSSLLLLIVLAWTGERFFQNRQTADPALLFSIRIPGYLIGGIIFLGMGATIWSYSKGYQRIVKMPAGTAVFLSPELSERYQWAAEHTTPGDYLYEAYRPAVNFPMELKNPTKLPMLRPNSYTSSEQVASVISDLSIHRPRFILWAGSWNKSADERAVGDNIGPLYEYLLENYRLREELSALNEGPTQVWEISN